MPRHTGFLSLILMLALGAFLIGNPQSPVPQATRTQWQRQLEQLYQTAKNDVFQLAQRPLTDNQRQSSSTATSQSSSAQPHSGATPMLSLIQGEKVARTYVYHFKAGTPTNVQHVFTQAIHLYNATGIVVLQPGTTTTLHNQLTFGTYHKHMSKAQLGTIELGEGGPQLIEQVGPGASNVAINHGTALLNTTYSQSISLPVALHELGHALGLAHSSNRESVMYPIDQGHTQLSAGDLAGLKAIYH